MLWKPITAGEQAFLFIYEALGRRINVKTNELASLDFLFSDYSFQEFMRLSATLEVFVRSLRGATHIYSAFQHVSAVEFGKRLAKNGYVTSSLSRERSFCEMLKSAAQIAARAAAAPDALSTAIKHSAATCYICGVRFEKSHPHNAATVEHLWPLSLGGASQAENLLPACVDCNTKRGNTITWAWGPVQSTDYRHEAGKNPKFDLRFSLATSRLMFEASGRNRMGPRRTLKEAAIQLWPLFSELGVNDTRHRVYFELFQNVRELL